MNEELTAREAGEQTAGAERTGAPSEVESLRAELEAIRMGARPDCARDVVVLAGASGTADSEALAGVLAKYPHFKHAPAPGAPNPPGAGEAADPFLMGFKK